MYQSRALIEFHNFQSKVYLSFQHKDKSYNFQSALGKFFFLSVNRFLCLAHVRYPASSFYSVSTRFYSNRKLLRFHARSNKIRTSRSRQSKKIELTGIERLHCKGLGVTSLISAFGILAAFFFLCTSSTRERQYKLDS